MSERTRTWPARTGLPGFLVWLSTAVAVVAIIGFVWRLTLG